MKRLLILFVYLFSFFNLFSQVNPVGAGRIPNATTNFTTSVPYGFSLIDANTNKSYRVIRANGLDFNKKLSDYTLGTDYLGSLTSLSVICNNGITKTLTDSTSTPVLTLGLGNITPTSISTSGAVTANNLWYLNGNTLGAKKTLGSADNQDFGIITNNTERLTVLNNGNVGIGVINPKTALELGKFGSIGTGSYGYSLLIRPVNSAYAARFAFNSGGAIGGSQKVVLMGESSNGVGDLSIKTSSDSDIDGGTGTFTDKFIISNTGDVVVPVGKLTTTLGDIVVPVGSIRVGAAANDGTNLSALGVFANNTSNLFNIKIFNATASINDVAGLGFGVHTNSGSKYMKSAIVHQRKDSWGKGDLVFLVDGNTDASDVALTDEKARLTSDGNYSVIGTLTGTRLISNIAQGTAPLSVTSTTKVTNLNADRIDDLHSYEQRLFNNAAQALGTNSFACGTGSYAGIRSGDAIYPYVQWQEFLCDTCIRVDANTTVTYTDSQGATQTYTNSTNYVQILCVITETVDKVLVDNVSVMPYNRCRTLYTYNRVLGSGEYVMSSTLLSSGQKQLIVYTWNTTSTIIPTSSASIYVATKSNNSNYSGYSSVASGYYSVASGAYSVASGISSVASGYSSVASGNSSVASGNSSVASGYYSVASGAYSVASGAYSVASGNSSVASGVSSVARDYYSQSHGYNTVASKQAEFVIGRYNIASSSTTNSNSYGNYGFIFGIGTSDANRINGFTLDWSGNSISAGTVTGTRLISNIATGTSPLSVTSTTKVPRLNVANSDSLGGYPASHFGTGNGSVTSIATTSPLTGGTITTTGTISIDSDTLTSWYSKQNKGKLAYDSLNYRYRRGDTATVLLSQNRASHQYLGKYANAVSATLVNTIPDVESDIDYYMPFLINADESNSLNTNSYFIYNPHLNLLSTNLLGNVTGNTSGSSGSCTGTASYANKVEIDTIATNLDARIPFMSSTGGNQKLYMDNTIKYNSGTETLTVPNLAGNATSSNKTDSVIILSDFLDEDIYTYVPYSYSIDDYNMLYFTDGGMMYNPYHNILRANFEGYLVGDVTGNATTSTTSGTADVALALDDPTMYNLTDFNSYGAAAYSVPIANGSGGITWGATSGGINAKIYADLIATSNITLSGSQTIDGITATNNMRILVTGQTLKKENGIYLIPAVGDPTGSWTRTTNADTWSELYQAYIPIKSGTTYGGSSWYCTIPSTGTLNTTDITFTEFLFPSSIEAGAGLTKTGTTLSTNVDNSTIEIHTDTLRIKDLGITTAKLANSSVTNAKIPAAAGIDVTKLQGVSGTTGSGNMVLSGHPAFSSSPGTSPFTVSSTTKVSNLNADQVDGADLETTITSSDTKIPSSKAVTTALNLKANLASPTFTGTPTAPTAAVETSTTQLATTAFVYNATQSYDKREIVLFSTTSSDLDYSASSTDYTIIVNATYANGTIILPSTTTNQKHIIYCKNISTNSHTVKVTTYDYPGGERIHFHNEIYLGQEDCVGLQCLGNQWYVISRNF